MRHFLSILLFCLLGNSLLAGTGPGNPIALSAELEEFLADFSTEPKVNTTDFSIAASIQEREELATFFSAPPTVSGTGDDLRKVAAFTDEIKGKVDSARAILNMVREETRQIQNLVDAQLASLPLGIKQTVGNTEIFIAIAEARLTPSAAEVDIYLSLDLPDTDQDPIFLAKGIGWSRQGGFVGDIELELIADWGIDFNAGRSRLILRADDGGDLGGTFVRINCDGFVAGRINATVLFSRNWVLPVVNGEPLTDELLAGTTTSEEIYSGERVQADFAIDIDAQNGFDFLAQMEVPMPFVFKGKEQVEVTIGIMAIDLSDVVNPTGMFVPPNYVSPHGNGPGALVPSWQGFYLAGLEIQLPEKLSKEGNPPIEVGAPYLIIDKMGITVHLYATNLLPLGEKSADGWAFSVDRVDLKITANQFEEAGIEGKINVPLLANAAANCGGSASDVPPSTLDPNDCLLYDALFIAGGDVYFTIESQTDYCADLWKAEVIIEANSKLMLAYEDEQFNASALLFGSISIDAQINSNFGLTMDELSFDSLVLSNRPQYFSPGVWDFPESITAQFGAFSLGFEHISMALDPTSNNTDGRDVALSFQAWFNLDAAMDIDVAGSFEILGYLNEEDDRQKWRFKRIKVNAISVEASTDSWSLGATIAFYENDVEWGTGFYGSGHLFLTMVGGDAGFAAVAQFGTAPDGVNKYFFVDVIARLGSGIPLPGGIKLMAIGGGVYTNMSRADGGEIQSFVNPDDGPVGAAANAVAASENWNGEGSSPLNGIVGISTSGIAYEVDPGNKFGAFLQVVIAGPSPEAFSVNARLELIVNDDGGWQARIDGNIMIMAPVNYTNEYKIESGVGIFVNMAYTHTESYKGFQASADVFVNVAGGIIQGGNAGSPPLSGSGTSKGEYIASGLGYAGGVSMEFSNETWYVHIGHPTAGRIALKVGVGPLTVNFSTYFCIGKLVPPIPPLPSNVTAIAGDLDLSRDFAQYENASGFAFGASLELGADGKFLIFYYDFAAGIGFDINIRKYGDAICAGGGSNAPSIGVNGWYAAGQAWVYASGSVGIDVKLLFVTVRKEILSAGVAAVLQLKGPNPTWARGTFAGYYSILGGLISGSFNIQAEFGENCVIVGRNGGDPFDELDLISSLDPIDGDTATLVSTVPTAYLVMGINEESELGPKIYRLKRLQTKLKKVSTGAIVPGVLDADEGSFSIRVTPDEYLEGDTEYEILVEVKLESRPVGGGGWSMVKTELKRHTFTTAPSTPNIVEANVEYSYPLQGQANFYRLEYLPGYLKLKRVQPTLTNDVTAVFTAAGSSTGIARQVAFDAQTKEYTWTNAILQTDQVYKMEFIQYYVPPTGGGGGGGQQQGGSLPNGGVGGPSVPEIVAPMRPVAVNDPRVIHTIYFRTSEHNRFEDKIEDVLGGPVSHQNVQQMPKIHYTGMEAFGPAELGVHVQLDSSMVSVEVDESETWTTTTGIKPQIIDALPFDSGPGGEGSLPNRTQWNALEFPLPYKGNRFRERTTTSSHLKAITAEDYDSGQAANVNSGTTLEFGFPFYCKVNLGDIRDLTEETWEDLMDDFYDLYGHPDNWDYLYMEPATDCFPGMHEDYEEWLPFEDDDPYYFDPDAFPPQHWWENDVLHSNEPCSMPQKFFDIWRVVRNYPAEVSYHGSTYPTNFKLILPGEKHIRVVQRNIFLN